MMQKQLSQSIYTDIFLNIWADAFMMVLVDPKLNVPKKDRIRLDVVDALKNKYSNLRWPGGCFADEYHWRDGIGRSKRPKMVNTHWGGVTEIITLELTSFTIGVTLLGTEDLILPVM